MQTEYHHFLDGIPVTGGHTRLAPSCALRGTYLLQCAYGVSLKPATPFWTLAVLLIDLSRPPTLPRKQHPLAWLIPGQPALALGDSPWLS